ncbi:MAG: hypothetical protein VXW44_09445 [SAR324 cluster bacterium]|nr:hypothetical protein [SAR324 cluster bacterium]
MSDLPIGEFALRDLLRALWLVALVFICLILPFYLWQQLAPESYQEFWLKSVSPMSRDTRNKILRQRSP